MLSLKGFMTLRKGFSTLTVALLVSILGLGLAVSSVSQLTGSKHETTTNIQRTEAVNCVESAIELATVCIKTTQGTVLDDCQQTSNVALDSTSASCSYRYSVSALYSDVLIPKISVDKTEILSLNPTGSTKIDISWKTDVDNGGNALEVNLLTDNGDGYDLEQIVYTCSSTTGGIESGGVAPTQASYDGNTGECSISGGISLSGESFVQLTSRFNDSYAVAVHISGSNTPLQGYSVDATGIAGQVERYGSALFLNSNFGRVFNASFMAGDVQ